MRVLFIGYHEINRKQVCVGCHPDKHFHILYFNARSVCPKLDELHAPEVVCVTETWLCDEIGESEATILGYICIRCGRNRHGGVVIALSISDKLEHQVQRN